MAGFLSSSSDDGNLIQRCIPWIDEIKVLLSLLKNPLCIRVWDVGECHYGDKTGLGLELSIRENEMPTESIFWKQSFITEDLIRENRAKKYEAITLKGVEISVLVHMTPIKKNYQKYTFWPASGSGL